MQRFLKALATWSSRASVLPFARRLPNHHSFRDGKIIQNRLSRLGSFAGLSIVSLAGYVIVALVRWGKMELPFNRAGRHPL
jgi:hypothetical protein